MTYRGLEDNNASCEGVTAHLVISSASPPPPAAAAVAAPGWPATSKPTSLGHQLTANGDVSAGGGTTTSSGLKVDSAKLANAAMSSPTHASSASVGAMSLGGVAGGNTTGPSSQALRSTRSRLAQHTPRQDAHNKIDMVANGHGVADDVMLLDECVGLVEQQQTANQQDLDRQLAQQLQRDEGEQAAVAMLANGHDQVDEDLNITRGRHAKDDDYVPDAADDEAADHDGVSTSGDQADVAVHASGRLRQRKASHATASTSSSAGSPTPHNKPGRRGRPGSRLRNAGGNTHDTAQQIQGTMCAAPAHAPLRGKSGTAGSGGSDTAGGGAHGNGTPALAAGAAVSATLVTLPPVCEEYLAQQAREARNAQLIYRDVEVMVELIKEDELQAAFNPTGGEADGSMMYVSYIRV